MAYSASSPVPTSAKDNRFLQNVLKRRKDLFAASSAHKWALGNLVAAAAVLWEARNYHLASLLFAPSYLKPHPHPAVGLILYGLLVVLLTNVALDVYHYFFPFSGGDDILLSEKQMRLLGVAPNDPGFRLSPAGLAAPAGAAAAHPNPFSPPKEGSFIISSSTPFGSPASPAASPSSAWSLNNTSSAMSPNTSLNSNSWVFQDPANVTPNQRRSTFHSSFEAISSEKSLDGYLQEFESWERRHSLSGHPDLSPTTAAPGNTTLPSLWKPSVSQLQGGPASNILDYSVALSKMNYQLSTTVPGSQDVGVGGKENQTLNSSSSLGRSESLCYRVGIDPNQLVSWMENLRMWISQTILVRLVDEINETNARLSDLGMKDVLIGEVGLEKVRKFAQMPAVLQHMALHKLLPFLELTVHQDYLVERVRALAQGGAMSEYKWNAGGRYKGADWSDKLPTDAELVMHCVACYLDSRLPPVKGVVDGRVFSTLYLFRQPDLPKANELKVGCAILQVANKPPHYVLQVNEDRMELNAGRNNMMHSLLFFLYLVKTREHGVLGRVNLGRSGINVLWVIE